MDFKDRIYELELWRFDSVDCLAFEALSPLRYYLNLSGITVLDEPTAQAMAGHPGILDLSGLQEAPDTVLKILAEKKGGIWLNGLTKLSSTALEAFARHEGDLYLRGLVDLEKNEYKKLKKKNIFLDHEEIEIRQQAREFEAFKQDAESRILKAEQQKSPNTKQKRKTKLEREGEGVSE